MTNAKFFVRNILEKSFFEINILRVSGAKYAKNPV